ncbi:flavodoxin [Shewanella sp. D64]|uniref:flavodoxin n=1 Tax=unclassified Shewanella TaxID=196818 RepID=UPI0022BA343E|nr:MULTISPECIES: flavodoxin [unclassified Shewanella]MEC4727040.1 flavodoxin [Shewanella sp. D64]MEC4737779.1 flavodoxin [Shewanella sp. E94]WBJ93963.1 flavodoxin [Shewanella sp. MTB7]
MRKVNLIFGTVYGNAQFVAETLRDDIQEIGKQVKLFQSDELTSFLPPQHEVLLIVCSTTGQGDIPDDILPWFEMLKSQAPYLPNLQYGVIALGDSSYDTFCRAGIQFDELLTELGAHRVGRLLKIDAGETMEPELAAKAWLQIWNKQIDTEAP